MSVPAAPAKLQLQLPASPASVEVARLALLDFVAPRSPRPGAIFHLELVLEEVLMNITMHAYADRQPGDTALIGFSAVLTAAGVELCFRDHGPPFDATTAIEPPRPQSLDDAEPGGLGLRLLHRHASAMHYARSEGHNVLTVTVALN
jgi:serine/threonine-protein kinase RsbW